MEPRKIGLMGGTFDPIHEGHLHMAKAARISANLDEVWFIPLGDPPHKSDRRITPGDQRFEMIQLATQFEPAYRVLDIELQRSGKTYTVETLRQLCTQYPLDSFFYIIGADTLLDLFHWREIEHVASLCSFLVFERPGIPKVWVDAAKDQLAERYQVRTQIVSAPQLDISSTQIRRRAALGESLDGYLPMPVIEYIKQMGLYQTHLSDKHDAIE